MTVRLHVILARDSPRAVVFRRGPSKQVLVLTWDTENDRIEEGQWLKGRIYERRCDVSPDGKLLVYFAAKHRPPYGTWTAISRPPFLTARALWPKGDAWGGGGLFQSNRELLLNHWANQMELAPDFALPRNFTVRPFGPHSGWGEDDPIWATRMERDGWIRASGGAPRRGPSDAKVWIDYDPPVIWEKRNLRDPRYLLRFSILGIKEQQGPWYLTEHSVVDAEAGKTRIFPRSDWADWSRGGDLLLASGGCLYRGRGIAEPALVADLRDRRFHAVESPAAARKWP